jgi:hypothetical protein
MDIALTRYSPAWFIFMLGMTAISTALFAACFIGSEYIAVRFMEAHAPVEYHCFWEDRQ